MFIFIMSIVKTAAEGDPVGQNISNEVLTDEKGLMIKAPHRKAAKRILDTSVDKVMDGFDDVEVDWADDEERAVITGDRFVIVLSTQEVKFGE